MAVTKDEILFHEMKNENINTLLFLEFMKGLNDILKSKKDKKYLIILDNCTVHKTDELIKIYVDEKLNILFDVQYCSYFNCVKLCFKALKKSLYYKLYEIKEELIKELLLIMKKEDFKKTLIKNFRETLEEYLRF